jgi:hypothetical protein
MRPTTRRAIADATKAVRAVVIQAHDLPHGTFAAVEVAENEFMCAYKPDAFTQEGARQVAHLVLGNYEDCTVETAVTVAADCSAEGVYAFAVENKQLPLLKALIPPFLSPDPLASFTWLASVEQDPELREAYSIAAELVRARGGAK